MKKYFKIIIPLIFIFLIVGISVRFGNFNFTTKYYDSPDKAFMNNYTPPAYMQQMAIDDYVGTYSLDEGNALLFATTKDHKLLVAEMKTQKDKFAYIGGTVYYYEYTNLAETKYNTTLLNDGSNVKWLISSKSSYANENTDIIKAFNLEKEAKTFYLVIHNTHKTDDTSMS